MAQDDDARRNAGPPQLYGLTDAGNGQPIRSVFQKHLRQLYCAVAIGVGLDDGRNQRIRPDGLTNMLHIIRRRV